MANAIALSFAAAFASAVDCVKYVTSIPSQRGRVITSGNDGADTCKFLQQGKSPQPFWLSGVCCCSFACIGQSDGMLFPASTVFLGVTDVANMQWFVPANHASISAPTVAERKPL